MIRDHSTIEELLAVQALGGLDGDDVDALARLRAEHGDCEECRRLEAEFTDTAGRLAFSVAPVPIDPSIADRILATSAPGEPVGVAADERVADNREARRGRRRWQAVVAVAAAIALVVVSVAVFGPSRTIGINAASTEQRVVAFSGDQGELTVAYVPGRSGAVLWGSGLPDPGQGNVYEIWAIEGDRPVSGGCVSPQGGSIAVHVDSDLDAAEAMALTVEPSECPPAPTSQPFALATLA